MKLIHPITLISKYLYHIPSLQQYQITQPNIHIQKQKQTTTLSYKNKYIKIFNTITIINNTNHQPKYLIKNKNYISFTKTKHINITHNKKHKNFQLKSIHISIHNYII